MSWGFGWRADMASVGKTANQIQLSLQEGTPIARMASRPGSRQETSNPLPASIQSVRLPLAPPLGRDELAVKGEMCCAEPQPQPASQSRVETCALEPRGNTLLVDTLSLQLLGETPSSFLLESCIINCSQNCICGLSRYLFLEGRTSPFFPRLKKLCLPKI